MESSTTGKSSRKSIITRDLGKRYQIYASPTDRLKQALWRGRRNYCREFWALRNVSLEIEKGETVAIIGRNGSGKSTLLQMICGTLSPTEGKVETSGTIAALLELGSGFNPEFTGIENIYLNASLLGLHQEQIKARLEDIQSFADIGDFVYQPVKTYSSGMLVRLAFAVIAHVEPSVLIVDEALSVGDAVFSQRCMRFIRRFTEGGTLLFVSHDLNAVSSLCEKAIWIESGRVRMNTQTAPILTAYTRYCLEASNSEIQSMASAEAIQKNVDALVDNSESRVSLQEATAVNTVTNEDSIARIISTANELNALPEQNYWDNKRDYGNQHAYITRVELVGMDGQRTNTPNCGEIVQLQISAQSIRCVESFIAGFVVRDRTGQVIFGENSTGQDRVQVAMNHKASTNFEFVMPFLQPGSYSLSVAISNGDAKQFQVMHYKPDIMILEPMVGNRPVQGVFATTTMTIKSDVHAK
ncbi:ABC transporter ATP-binding protein [Synechococcus sp. CS-1324]|uniref:ABC transporter ATP-binding protein n=1 Tax=Synechococcus sp. CS-1324 TaxID=2847980 RepID=UPI000DB1CA38|nr:ABC transporter ATP-binding protein [Synechococcus sp. CS-1324]MCT0231081.1 ABC transporter ATP-binding protein [Synechococcus sp. CS-1324]PZV05443.1 MAG: ABC transporter ATP-binding protein [Cyanobium sp.]